MMELKPCPFCGGEAKMAWHYIAQNKKQWAVQCSCGARFFFKPRRRDAAEAWNKRIGESNDRA